MKAESTIKREIRRLRATINTHSSKAVQEEAYGYETALQWVLDRCDWSPTTLALESAGRR